jgi:hypothetical protein
MKDMKGVKIMKKSAELFFRSFTLFTSFMFSFSIATTPDPVH